MMKLLVTVAEGEMDVIVVVVVDVSSVELFHAV